MPGLAPPRNQSGDGISREGFAFPPSPGIHIPILGNTGTRRKTSGRDAIFFRMH